MDRAGNPGMPAWLCARPHNVQHFMGLCTVAHVCQGSCPLQLLRVCLTSFPLHTAHLSATAYSALIDAALPFPPVHDVVVDRAIVHTDEGPDVHGVVVYKMVQVIA